MVKMLPNQKRLECTQGGKHNTHTTRHPACVISSLVRKVSRLYRGASKQQLQKRFLLCADISRPVHQKSTKSNTCRYTRIRYIHESSETGTFGCCCHCKDTPQEAMIPETPIPRRAQIMPWNKNVQGVSKLLLPQRWPSTHVLHILLKTTKRFRVFYANNRPNAGDHYRGRSSAVFT